MKVLLVDKFFYLKGGAERVFFETAKLLEDKGHKVVFFSMKHPLNLKTPYEKYFVSNIDYEKRSILHKMKAAANVIYSFEARKKIEELIRDEKPDIAHLHNFAHYLSPSILFGLRKYKIPVVMSVHDYKLVCPSYSMLNHGKVCELCRGGKFYHAFTTVCHKDSFIKSLLVALESYLHHDILHSYRDIECYICPSMFTMNKVREMGLKGNLAHIPNFVVLARFKPYHRVVKDIKCGVYWGRLSSEKGVETIVDAVAGMPIDFTIIGDGPMKDSLRTRIEKSGAKNIRLVDSIYNDELLSAVSKCDFLIIPSIWHEVFGLTIIEAFAMGMPVIGAGIGGIPESIRDGRTGFLFKPGDVDGLRDKIRKLISDPDIASRMAANAKAFVEARCNADAHYESLIKVYERAIGSK
jgi:glycosyltransferase involved in cell wall biosynthesis